MKRFFYSAIKDKNEMVSGHVEAVDKFDAKEKIRDMGFIPAHVYEENFENINKIKKIGNKPIISIGTNDLKIFTSSIQTILASGLSTFQALENISLHAPNKRISIFAGHIYTMMKGGATFSEALMIYKDIVGVIYVSICKTGEESGALPQTLMYLSVLLDKKINLRNKFIRLSIYPTFLFVLLFGIYMLFGKFIFPTIIMGMDMGLPPMVAFFMKGSSFITSYFWLIVLFFIAILFAIKYTVGFKVLKDKLSDVFAKLPLIKDCMTYISLSHYMSALYISYQAGVPIVDALRLSEETIPVNAIRKKAAVVTELVGQGNRLTDSFYKSNLLTPVMLTMMSTGELSGELGKMFSDISNAVHRDLDNAMNILAQVFPVVMLVVAGVFTGIVAVTMYSLYFSALGSLAI